MSIRLPDAQVNALATISSRHVEIGMRPILGIRQAATNALQLRGLSDTVGIPRPVKSDRSARFGRFQKITIEVRDSK